MKEKKIKIPVWFIISAIIGVIISLSLFSSASAIKNRAKQTAPREALSAESSISSDKILQDDLKWISSESTLKAGMDYFYKKTGVQPFLYITDNIEGEGKDIEDNTVKEYLENMYDSLFDDEGHLIFCFLEYSPSKYHTYIYAGKAADTVVDADARNVILNLADRYYSDKKTYPDDEDYFSAVFKDSADEIMKDTSSSTVMATVYTLIAIGIFIILIGLFISLYVTQKREAEYKHMKKILSINIKDTSKDDELMKKYEDK